MLGLGSYLILSPAYGKDYRSKDEIKAAWDAGHSFMVENLNAQGKYISKQEFIPLQHNFVAVEFKYAKGYKTTVFRAAELG